MSRKKSLSIISVLLLLLTCGMCFIITGCSSDSIDGSSFSCETTEIALKQGDTIVDALNGVSVTFTFGYAIDGHEKGSSITATGYSQMIANGFMVSSIDTSTATGSDPRTLTISYLNKSVKIKYTVSASSQTEQKPTQNDPNATSLYLNY